MLVFLQSRTPIMLKELCWTHVLLEDQFSEGETYLVLMKDVACSMYLTGEVVQNAV